MLEKTAHFRVTDGLLGQLPADTSLLTTLEFADEGI
jgi:hypothetical protein